MMDDNPVTSGFTGFLQAFVGAALGLIACAAPHPCGAQSVSWPAFGPDAGLPRLDGLTDTLPDLVGPIDGSAELTIFTEGNHYPVLLPMVLDGFPAWCKSAQACRADAGKILIVTLPQQMVVDVLVKGGIRLGNAVLPVGPNRGIFPNLVMGGAMPLGRLARAGIVKNPAVVFARDRGLGLLLRRDLEVADIETFSAHARRIVLASESEPGARGRYRTMLDALIGGEATEALLTREVRTFPGRLGIQHRDIPYALLNDIADGGVILSHLAAFYAQTYPGRLRHVAVPAAEPFGQEIAMARTSSERGSLPAAFERFFLETARTAYPAAGFATPQSFQYGAELALNEK